MPIESYVIKVDRPRETPISEMKGYISEAVGCWSGQFHPDHPLMGHDIVKDVQRLTTKRALRLGSGK